MTSDGNIRYFEYQNDKFEFLSEYKSSDPQRGIAFLPKRGVNVHENEVMRAFKTVNDGYIEPISFIVPRRAEVFQDDIYPPAVGMKSAMSVSEWLDGKEGLPAKIDLAAVYAGEEPQEVASDYRPAPRDLSPKAPSPAAQVQEPESTAEPTPALKGPPPSMNQQTASIKDLASKFNDEEEASSSDDSSFEQIPKPTDRSSQPHPIASPSAQISPPAPASRGIGDPLAPVLDKPDDFDKASQIAANQTTATQIENQAEPLSQQKAEPTAEQLPPSRSASGQQAPEVQASLAEIKSLLEQQSKTMSAQNMTIGRLTEEVDRLRAKIGES